MLVLSRRINEKIVLPGLGVTIEVLKVQSGKVKLGISAPTEVSLLRGELLAPVDPAFDKAKEGTASLFTETAIPT